MHQQTSPITLFATGALMMLALIFSGSAFEGLTFSSQAPSRPKQAAVVLASKTEEDTPAPQLKLSMYLSTKYRVEKSETVQIVKAAYKEAAENKISPLLVLAVIEQESSLRPKVKSRTGARGLMQVDPKWHMPKASAKAQDKLYQAAFNIKMGSKILAAYLKKHKGDRALALKKYSGSARSYNLKVARHERRLAKVLASV